MDQKQFEVFENKQSKFYFQLKDEEEQLICKSILFESLHDCHQAILKVKAAAENTPLSTTNIKHQR